MKKILVVLVLLILSIFFLQKKEVIQDKIPNQLLIKPIAPKFEKLNLPLLCVFEKQQILEVNPESKPLEGGDGYKYWEVKLLNDQEAFLITKVESPYGKGQHFIAATDCKPAGDISKYKKELAQDCMSIYLWDKKSFQITLQCGYMTNEGYLFSK